MPIARSFYFIRHGQTDWNTGKKKILGRTDLPLNNTGKIQAKESCNNITIPPIDLIVTSPLSRAYETAEIINEKFKTHLIVEPQIIERDFGNMEGVYYTDMSAEQKIIDRAAPKLVEKNTGFGDPINGETFKTLGDRIITAINKHLTNHPNKNILFVSHGGVFRALSTRLFGELQRVNNATPYLFEKQSNQWHKSPLYKQAA